MKRRIIAFAAVTAIGLSPAVTLHAVAAPTPPATSTPTAKPSGSPSSTATSGDTWGWPQATFKGRTMTVSNLKPGWNVYVTATNTETDKDHTFRAKAQSGSVTIQLKGLPAGTYDFLVEAGDLPANESHYPGIKIGSGTAPKPAPARTHSTGLANTGV